ncbi:trehalose-phosphatase [uncultured Erythrobacter sp.]|uniref:trehalose-phosphatase n=1 Tax=uncultured Erythrobacter sp. TaxID=263913 RepID=UPI00265B20C7|nr:trehalose-phosphatase [uncultured Erythrobacter sp.]
MTLPQPLALLLDFDGTLVPIVATPDAIVVSDDLHALIAEAMERLDGRVAIISGRSLEQLDALWGESLSGVTVAASHGLELRSDGLLSAPEHSALFARLARATEKRFATQQGVVIELKSFGLGLHYRLAPTLREAVHDWAKECAENHRLAIQPGDMVFELLLPGANKGEAVRQIMDRWRFAGSSPIYIGDDLTDIPAMLAARKFGGRGIAVGRKIAAYADDVLAGPAEVISHIRKLLA